MSHFASVDAAGEPLVARLKRLILKPPRPGIELEPDGTPTPEALDAGERSANDKERLIGLFAAPLAAGIALMVTNSLIANDPSAILADGQPNRLHVSVGLYHEVLIASLALSLFVLVASWFRKRLLIGVGLALYGLTIFNLRFWGFGVPFLIGGAWYLVRAYRIHQRFRDARTDTASQSRLAAVGPGASSLTRPTPNKRYTPPQSRSPQ